MHQARPKDVSFFLCALWGWDVSAELDTSCTRQGLRTLAFLCVHCGDGMSVLSWTQAAPGKA